MCSQRAQLLGVTQHELRRQKLMEILIFYVGQKISGRIYAPIGLTLLRAMVVVGVFSEDWHPHEYYSPT